LSALAVSLIALTAFVSFISASTAPEILAHASRPYPGGFSIHEKNGETPDWIMEIMAHSRGLAQVSVSI
jgi:hypothetical protein